MSGSALVKLWWDQSCVRPGFYYLSTIVDGFYFPGCYAVVDDFGNLVEVPR